MSLNKKLSRAILSAGLGLTGLVGCNDESTTSSTKPNNPSYFAQINQYMLTDCPVAIIALDVDGDGDQDLIVGVSSRDGSMNEVNLYLFKNDGKGNYSQ